MYHSDNILCVRSGEVIDENLEISEENIHECWRLVKTFDLPFQVTLLIAIKDHNWKLLKLSTFYWDMFISFWFSNNFINLIWKIEQIYFDFYENSISIMVLYPRFSKSASMLKANYHSSQITNYVCCILNHAINICWKRL